MVYFRSTFLVMEKKKPKMEFSCSLVELQSHLHLIHME